jgi:Tol biopolymer transport system component
VYFTSAATDREPGELNMIPVLGGTQPRFVAASITGGDVSHDGRIAAFQKTGDRVVLTILDVNWRSIATIEVPAAIEHLTPRWSPDASAIAFVINGGRGVEYRIHVVDVATGELKQIRQALRIRGVCWLPDGSGLIYASAAGSTLLYPPVFQLRVVSRDGDVERQLISGEDSYVHPDMVQSGKVLSSRIRMKSNLWRYPVAGSPAENVANARQITDQASQVQTPTVSPDETEIAYLSDSGGHANVWVIKTDGSDRRRQLTFERDPGISVGLPLWAPKGHAIVYVTLGGSSSSEWIVDSRGRESPRVLAEGATAAAWTGDAKWIYYQRHSSGTSDIFKMAADRSSGEIPVRRNASIPAISPDGATLYYSPSHPGNAHEIYRANPPDTGAGEFLTRYSPSRVPYWPTGVAISPDGRWLAVPLKDGGTTNIWTISTVDGTYRQITSFGHRAILIARQVSWSPKSDFIYAAIQEDNADVVLLDGIETSVRRAR